eukprot:m.97478 g.97478  ORF g.97478 m.97478 type:complete len:55 (+) comp13102_c0_seq2:152-316(+)
MLFYNQVDTSKHLHALYDMRVTWYYKVQHAQQSQWPGSDDDVICLVVASGPLSS